LFYLQDYTRTRGQENIIEIPPNILIQNFLI